MARPFPPYQRPDQRSALIQVGMDPDEMHLRTDDDDSYRHLLGHEIERA